MRLIRISHLPFLLKILKLFSNLLLRFFIFGTSIDIFEQALNFQRWKRILSTVPTELDTFRNISQSILISSQQLVCSLFQSTIHLMSFQKETKIPLREFHQKLELFFLPSLWPIQLYNNINYITVWCALSFGTNSFAHIYYQMLCRFSLSTLSPVAYFIIINNFIFNHSLAFHFMFYLKFLFCYMNHSKFLEMKQYLNLKTKIISKSRNLNF